ncbi:hypothetical protein ACH4TX_20930 [Streptomyces sp. NPDC021098]
MDDSHGPLFPSGQARAQALPLSPGHNEAVTALAPGYYRAAVPT